MQVSDQELVRRAMALTPDLTQKELCTRLFRCNPRTLQRWLRGAPLDVGSRAFFVHYLARHERRESKRQGRLTVS